MKKCSNKACSADSGQQSKCCDVESVITIDDRGQMVLPKTTRESAGINPGDKLAVISWKKDGKVGYILLMRIDELTDMVNDKLGPYLGRLTSKE